MPMVMLKRNWQGHFRRTLPGATKDDPPRVLEFAPGELQEVTDAELVAIKDDIGAALHVVEFDGRRPKVIEWQPPPEGASESEPEATEAAPLSVPEPSTLDPEPEATPPDAKNPGGRSAKRRR